MKWERVDDGTGGGEGVVSNVVFHYDYKLSSYLVDEFCDEREKSLGNLIVLAV